MHLKKCPKCGSAPALVKTKLESTSATHYAYQCKRCLFLSQSWRRFSHHKKGSAGRYWNIAVDIYQRENQSKQLENQTTEKE